MKRRNRRPRPRLLSGPLLRGADVVLGTASLGLCITTGAARIPEPGIEAPICALMTTPKQHCDWLMQDGKRRQRWSGATPAL